MKNGVSQGLNNDEVNHLSTVSHECDEESEMVDQRDLVTNDQTSTGTSVAGDVCARTANMLGPV